MLPPVPALAVMVKVVPVAAGLIGTAAIAHRVVVEPKPTVVQLMVTVSAVACSVLAAPITLKELEEG